MGLEMYQKLQIDLDQWPPNYYKSSRNCPLCQIRWPDMEWFDHCPKCDAPTESRSTKAPSLRWPDAAKRLLHARFDNFYEEWNSQEIEDEFTDQSRQS
jgi:hypothetical protein